MASTPLPIPPSPAPVPSPDLTEILRITREHFPEWSRAEVTIEPLEKGGSDRRFYRLQAPDGRSVIFVQYGKQKEENRHYVAIGDFLRSLPVRVPEMYRHELEEGRIWMEDLGGEDLWSFREESWGVRRPLYEATLREVARLNGARADWEKRVNAPRLQPEFDARLYAWEQDYFFTHCLQNYCGVSPDALASHREALEALAQTLAAEPRGLVHRDFQSQNVVILRGEPCLIDFQGMRPGLAQYDLASLLLDPYVDLNGEEQAALFDYYCTLHPAGRDRKHFERIYNLCAAQRLMQALGAYGFLGLQRERADFLAHIPVALPRLLTVLRRISTLHGLAELIAPLAEASARPSATGPSSLRSGPASGLD
jgi:aminoglycoside/choline kinase family phosphotransferase